MALCLFILINFIIMYMWRTLFILILTLRKVSREWEAWEAVSQARRTPRRPDIYAYVEDLGVNSSLIRPHYELPIDMVASSRKNKSRQSITVRKNKQPVSIGQSSNSHVNRTDSAHSINARSASNMIPCSPANNSTDVHITMILYQVVPRHLILQMIPLFNISKVRTRSTTKKLNHCLEN